MTEENLNLGEFNGVASDENLEGLTQDDVSEVSEMVFYFDNHEGPLDVLWRLVRSTKLNIKDVRIGEITGQFLEYVRSLNNIDMESMSWFIREAAKILEVKSASLLPKVETEEETDELDAEELYKRRMELYRLFKDASENLALSENVDRFYKEPEKEAGDYRFVLKNMNMQNLTNAFSKMLARMEEKAVTITERQVRKDRFTVKDSFENIKNKLDMHKKVKFNDFFMSDFTRSEIITTFLALLELLKLQMAIVTQDELFGEINIEKREGESTNAEELTEYN